jgi:hypothetical protein
MGRLGSGVHSRERLAIRVHSRERLGSGVYSRERLAINPRGEAPIWASVRRTVRGLESEGDSPATHENPANHDNDPPSDGRRETSVRWIVLEVDASFLVQMARTPLVACENRQNSAHQPQLSGLSHLQDCEERGERGRPVQAAAGRWRARPGLGEAQVVGAYGC